MKICDLALFSSETSSGVKTYIHNKIRFVQSLGPEVEHTVIIPAAQDYVEMQGRSKICGIRGIPTFYPGIQLAINIGRIADIVEREDPDLIEVNCQYTLPWAAFLATRRKRIPVVGVYHTDLPACARRFADDSGLPGAMVERLTEFYEGIIYRHFTTTIMLTNQMIPRLKKMGVHRTECLPCGVDTTTFAPSPSNDALRQQLGLLQDQKVLVYAGRLSPEKEISLLLAAFEKIESPNYILLIAGDGPEAASVQKFADRHPAVRYLGHFDSASELARIYSLADVVAVPSRYETFCMSAVEALACGAPVVGIENSGVATIVGCDSGALARPGDPSEFARQLQVVAEWPDRTATRDRCRVAAERYSWDRVFDGYFKTYEKLITAGENN